MQLLHFSRANVLMHATYKQKEGRSGTYWFKLVETENICDCPEREEDRRVLLGISLVENQMFLEHMQTNEPRYT